MKFFTLAVVLLFSIPLFSQTGTLIIATIEKNEIIIAADSRAAYFDSPNHTIPPIAYFDSTCKIFRIKQFAIAISGAFAINKTYYNTIIKAYNKTPFRDTSAYNTMKNFVDYLDKKFPIDSYLEKKSNNFILAGYVNSKPQMIWYSMSNDSIFRVPDLTIHTEADSLRKYIIKAHESGGTIYKQMGNAIYFYAKGENKTNTIGGPISIICVRPGNKIHWQQNNFSNRNPSTNNDFYNAVKNDKIKMHYLIPNGKERLLKTLKR